MIIQLSEAMEIDKSISKADLDAYETTIRNLTNNNFQNRSIRNQSLTFHENVIEMRRPLKGVRVGDTIEVNDSIYNDGLYVVDSISGNKIYVQGSDFIEDSNHKAIVTKVEYPSDIAFGLKNILRYRVKMGDKLGIKSETVSRMSTTYYDVNATDNIDGLPSSLYSFLDKYRRLRWA
jgi:putative uncharacterized protein gp41